jgi:hypothetical protein
MDLNFATALAGLGPNAAFRIANAARPATAYLFATLLPEKPDYDYHVESGYMTVRTTMAGLVGMDSPYPPGGQVETSAFSENTAKIANQVMLPEYTMRKLQAMLMQLQLSGQPTVQAIQAEALNFLNKVVVQAHMDTAEWLRAQALTTGAIAWAFNGKTLAVDYGIPVGNKLTVRTKSSNDAYGGSASKFWTDVREAKRLLKYDVRAVIAHPTTIDEILYNDVNKLQVLSNAGSVITVQRLIVDGSSTRVSTDARDTLTIIPYATEGEVLDTGTPGQTQKIPFMPVGKLLFVANNVRSGYRVGEGSTLDPAADLALGYTHIAPTVEGGGSPGRWADLFTPQDRPWQLVGRGVTNLLPVIEAPDKIVIATTEMQA